jgi:hypothetical protein
MVDSYELSRTRPNVLAWALGAIVIAAGIFIGVLGVLDVIDVLGRENVFSRRNSRALADAESMVIWGVMIFTIGCYIWRGARKRGWIDRSGRILISIGYLVIGFGMSKATHAAVKIWHVSSEKGMQRVALEAGQYFLGFGFIGALLVWIGVKMANESIILRVEGHSKFDS